ncbi:MAG TPA: hypothetical protein VFY73_15760 [Ideonella sp.]|uniref:hypothetical protein n=1 Tax=Ideonella sp. TaxID=1929293 RepID=UPI002E31235F|nr:hypothetical protein [Ideonella sp.]HEX5685477.1 hypothetical protein [Ideonella sp.]
MEVVRKKSPRAPSIGLQEALTRALAAYDKDRTHPAPTEVVAQNLGYKSANSGTALGAIASLRYYGLLDRPKDGQLAVSKAVETYRFTPDEAHRRELLVGFLLNPPLFKELLQLYKGALPSDATIRYELINRGFLPGPAETCVGVFRKSVEYADYFRASAEATNQNEERGGEVDYEDEPDPVADRKSVAIEAQTPRGGSVGAWQPILPNAGGEEDFIPIRLAGGRRAWLVVPHQLFEADKDRLKAQVDLLLTVEQEQSFG